MARIPISKRVRFEIFKRDDFTCQYCGAHPPQVVLEIDHIQPIASGGDDNPDNLVTSCFGCNRGKGAIELSDKAKPLAVKAVEIAEREEQLRGYSEIMEAKRQRLEDDIWKVIGVLEPGAKTYRRDRIQSIRRFVETLGIIEVLDAAEIAWGSPCFRSDWRRYRYFCGICWRKIRERTGEQP